MNDRFLLADEDVCHIGASLKDLGKKLFAFSKETYGTFEGFKFQSKFYFKSLTM
ncbi:MAG: hypothetical protein LBR60_05740 [Fibrobacter sp.]|jgi:hypothetical protein|nr:hypothetical protein [Fibrobacter sp.]